uniref:Uncharacterized protein n=2 Tax=Meloidogyne TaxID=189290 RepID=A0A914L267_MELIC
MLNHNVNWDLIQQNPTSFTDYDPQVVAMHEQHNQGQGSGSNQGGGSRQRGRPRQGSMPQPGDKGKGKALD